MQKNISKGPIMRWLNMDNDIKPLSEFESNTEELVKLIKKTKRPLILTQHGKSTAVLLDIAAYQALIEKLELLQEIQVGEKQIEDGKYLTHDQVQERIRKRYNK